MTLKSTSENLTMNRKAAPTAVRKRVLNAADTGPSFKMMFMNGVKVYTPPGVDLYPSQKRMISLAIKAAQEGKNALIESPTGSGKTLGLLSSVCSWLLNYEEKRRVQEPCPVHRARLMEDATEEEVTLSETMSYMEDTLTTLADQTVGSSFKLDESMDEPANSIKTASENCTCSPKVRIYYCTRTHKQIFQVVNEYKRMPFADMGTLKHTILASREQSCVNQDVREMSGDLNTNCKKVLEPKGVGCIYRDTLKNLTSGRGDRETIRNKLSAKGMDVWNIDELVEKLPKIPLDVCPYYLTNREFTKDANLIFCPFNYLLDPIVRESSDVNLKNSIIILDEAHNIEDVCRNAASFEFTDLEFAIALNNMKSKIEEAEKTRNTPKKHKEEDFDALSFLEEYVENVRKWHQYVNRLFAKFRALCQDTENAVPNKFNNIRSSNFDSERLCNWLSDVYLNKDGDDYTSYLRAFNQLTLKNDEKNGVDILASRNLQLSTTTIVLMEKLLFFYKFHSTNENSAYYRGNIEISPAEPPKQEQTDMLVEVPPKGMIAGHVVKLSFWSMLPSVAFDNAFAECRSIILASGTLCPLDTFCGELGVKFDYRMEGEQIIPPDRIFCAALQSGPSHQKLRLTFNNMANAYPDLTNIILDVCNICPGGVLIFVSSYRVLQQLKDTFQNTGSIRRLQSMKEVFYEPRDSRGMTDFLKQYEKAISIPKKKCTGAAMFAVFRGKVSEGLNFEDDKARAVISIGIPFPNVADQQVQQKKNFNDANAKKLNLLPGASWYEIQAYRAINQALGRCLRHKNDWGALIMIDERYNPKQTNISKWVRQQMRSGPYDQFREGLRKFVDYHVNNPIEMKPKPRETGEGFDNW